MAETPMERGIAIVRRLFGAAAGQTPIPADFGRITVEHERRVIERWREY